MLVIEGPCLALKLENVGPFIGEKALRYLVKIIVHMSGLSTHNSAHIEIRKCFRESI